MCNLFKRYAALEWPLSRRVGQNLLGQTTPRTKPLWDKKTHILLTACTIIIVLYN